MGNVFIFNSLNFFSLIILLLMYSHTLFYFKKRKTKYIVTWEQTLFLLIFSVALDTSCWLVNEQPGQAFYYANYILNIALFTVLTMFTTKFARFVKFSADGKNNRPLIRGVGWGLVGINFLLSFLSVFYPIVFTVDPVTNSYSRASGYYIMVVVLLLPLFYEFFELLTNRKFRVNKVTQNNVPLMLLMIGDVVLSIVFLLLQGWHVIAISLLFPTNTLFILCLYFMIISDSISTDYMSGMQNRLGFERYMRRLSRSNQHYVAFIYFDLNRFKTINDTFGHLAGDRAIKVFSEIVLNEIKIRDLAARIGGDEFVVVTQVNEPDHAEKIVQAILRETEKFNAGHPDQFRLEFSYGISYASPNQLIDAQQMLEEADKKMYDHKNKMHQKEETKKSA